MNKSKSTRYKVIAIVSLSVLLIISTLFLSLNNLFNLKNRLEKLIEPNRLISTLHKVQTDLTEIQSYIRAYSYTEDTSFLNKYHQVNANLDKKIHQLSRYVPDKQKSLYDSIISHISHKRELISLYINLQDNESSEDEINTLFARLNDYISKANENDESVNTDPARRKRIFKNILDFLNSKNNSDNSKESITLTEESLIELKNLLKNVKETNDQKMRLRTTMEMELLHQDIQIMNEISSLISDLVVSEERFIQQQKEQTAENIKHSLWILGIIIGLSFILIIIFVIRISRDIKTSENYRLQLEEAKQKAEELGEAKARFLASMSHEIRTPLTAIMGFSEQLQKNGHSQTQSKRYLNIIYKSSEHLLNIVNEILTFSSIESGKTHVEKQDFNFQELLEEICEVMQIKANEKNLYLEVSADKRVPSWFVGDSQKIRQILINLISNAIKFTEQGKVEVLTEKMVFENEQEGIKIQIKDTGKGIPEEKLNDIFNEFSQIEDPSQQSHSGTGLGLTITKKLVQMMEGEIYVESKPDKGSNFIVQLPLPTSADQHKELNSVKKPSITQYTFSTKVKVLLVDDVEWNRMLCKIVLDNMNVETHMASDGAEAIEKTKTNIYDLILMDIHMPGIDGLQATKQIRKAEKENPDLPRSTIIALTANVLQEDIKHYLKTGMDDYMIKPFKENDIYSKIRKVTDNKL